MKKQYLFLLIGILFFGSCTSDNEILTGQPGEENAAPQLIATIEQEGVTKKSGVIEDHDYTQGEKFYWTNGDATTVFFVNGGMTHPTQYKKAEYTADVASGVKSNSCTFNTGDSDITPADYGEYTAYGFSLCQPGSSGKTPEHYFLQQTCLHVSSSLMQPRHTWALIC